MQRESEVKLLLPESPSGAPTPTDRRCGGRWAATPHVWLRGLGGSGGQRAIRRLARLFLACATFFAALAAAQGSMRAAQYVICAFVDCIFKSDINSAFFCCAYR